LPRKRYIIEFVVHDKALTAISMLAQLAYFRMLAVSDDFGFVPGSISVLRKLCGFLEFLRNWPRVAFELVEAGLVSPLIHNGEPFFFFNPESFDRIQNHIVGKRTQSEYLHLSADEIAPLRVSPCDKKAVLQEILRMDGTSNSKKFLESRAREGKKKWCSSSSLLLSESEEQIMNRENLPSRLDFDHPAETIPAEVVRIMHRIGRRLPCDAYSNVTEYRWLPDLRALGLQMGFACILREALAFEQWILGAVESKQEKPKAKSNPRARFLGKHGWLQGHFRDGRARVDPATFTTGDTETSFPDITPQRDPWASPSS